MFEIRIAIATKAPVYNATKLLKDGMFALSGCYQDIAAFYSFILAEGSLYCFYPGIAGLKSLS